MNLFQKKDLQGLMDQHYLFIKKIIYLSEMMVNEGSDDVYLKRGEKLILTMIQMYLLILEMLRAAPGTKESQKLKELYQKDPQHTRVLINQEISLLKKEYFQGIRAREERDNLALICKCYQERARKNLHSYQEMKETINKREGSFYL